MGVYIKGMEMPKDIEPGLVIEFADGIDGKRYARLYHYRHGGLTEWLEAVPVPPKGESCIYYKENGKSPCCTQSCDGCEWNEKSELIADQDIQEFVGQIIDIFEDALEMMTGHEGAAEDDCPLISPAYYDDIEGDLIDLLKNWGMIA